MLPSRAKEDNRGEGKTLQTILHRDRKNFQRFGGLKVAYQKLFFYMSNFDKGKKVKEKGFQNLEEKRGWKKFLNLQGFDFEQSDFHFSQGRVGEEKELLFR